MKWIISFLLGMVALFATIAPAIAQDDAEGCKDYPLFNRMNGFFIYTCTIKEFDAYDFPVTDDKSARVEGPYSYYIYYQKEGETTKSALQIQRNFKSAWTTAGWSLKYVPEGGQITAVMKKAGKEIWTYLEPQDGGYMLTIIEQEAMKQEVTANSMLDALNTDGHIALQINFDTGKSTIKDDSKPMIEQMYSLLKDNPDLKVEIQGHTDNVGKPEANKTLSEERARTVMKALVDKGIDGKRLTASGFGDTKPVADNKTEEGKAQNRRVELIKK
ncbi:MAG: OmpA family protein [Syntrophales bacterium LBB04]|nr:OmpA family protein [Syntrophales bacterium LBB04]